MSRTVLVTGGSDGIGLAIAREFSSRGDKVIIVHRQSAASAAAVSATSAMLDIVSDLSDPGGIQLVLEELRSAGIATIDVLVNNAGIRMDALPHEASIDAQAERARRLLSTNFLAAYLMIIALADLLSSPGGRVVNITSRATYVGGDPLYAASKAALASLQISLAAPLGARGITINSVSPGFVPDTGFFRGRLTNERLWAEAKATKIGRVGTSEDIARAVAFLAENSNSYITGQSLRVDGGGTFTL